MRGGSREGAAERGSAEPQGRRRFSGRENRLRFSRCAGPSRRRRMGRSCWLYFVFMCFVFICCDPSGSPASSPSGFAARGEATGRTGRTLDGESGRERIARFAESPASERSERRRRAPGERPRTNGRRMGRGAVGCALFLAGATRRVVQSVATPGGGLQLDGARCALRWRRTAMDFRPGRLEEPPG